MTIRRQYSGGEELLAVDRAVDNPLVGVAFAAAALVDDRLQVVRVLEARVDVPLPVELVHDEVEVFVFVLGHVFDEERPGNFAAFYERLIHAENVAAPLRLVGAK